MSLRLITGPASLPVTAAEAKVHWRVDGSDLDSALATNITTATALVQSHIGRSIVNQTWEKLYDSFPSNGQMVIPRGPVQSITSITYYDTSEVLQTLATDQYALDNASDPAWVVRPADVSWPDVAEGVNNVIIRFVSGMDTAHDDYALVRGAIILTGKHLLDDPTSARLPQSAIDLLTNARSFAA